MTMLTIMRPSSILLLILLSLFMIRAGLSAESQETAADFSALMHENYEQVGIIKAAVIAGDLAAVSEPANWLATRESLPALPPVDEMRRYAERAAAAEDLVDAAAAVGEIGRTCGECHQANGIQVAIGFSTPPAPEEQSFAKQMHRHLWAADRMWAGLIGPSDIAWKQGADILADVNIETSDIAGEGRQKSQVSDLFQRIRAVGGQASQASSVELRSGLYGEFLSLCATCHALTGGGPTAR